MYIRLTRGKPITPAETFKPLSKAVNTPDIRIDLMEANFDTSRLLEDNEDWPSHESPVESVDDGLVTIGISVGREIEVA